MSVRTAHVLDDKKWRSDDIRTGEDSDFSSLLLPKRLLDGLKSAGFKYPSPVQLKSIPVGKIGKDLVIQAKAGTGKTLVFSVIALNMLLNEAKHPQVLIMAPTREIACQICSVIQSIAVGYKGVKCQSFIGGYRIEEDIPRIAGCQIIAGTPGRIKQLISYKILKTGGIRLFVLDEADQLLNSASFTVDIDAIFRALPLDKQVISASATYSLKLKKLTEKYFRDPLVIRLNENDLSLLGMIHFHRVIPVSKMPVIAYKQKLKFLENVLLNVKFGQCLVFCNMVTRVENLCCEIKKLGFSTTFLCSAIDQPARLKAIERLKKFKCKVLVSSDLSARGIDAENVNLVINFDLPYNLETYLHRVGRAGRYGSKCASVTFITCDEIEAYEKMKIGGKFLSYDLPDRVPTNLVDMHPERDIVAKVDQESSSDSSDDSEDGNPDASAPNSAIHESASVNLANLSAEKLAVSELASDESGSPATQSQLLDLNSNSANPMKEDNLNSASESMEQKDDKNCSFASVESSVETVVEINPLNEIVELAEVECESAVKGSLNEADENENGLVESILDEQSSSVLMESSIEKCQTKSDNIHEDKNLSPCFVNPDSDSVKPTGEKFNDDQSLVVNNKNNISKIMGNSNSDDFILTVVSFAEQYEHEHISTSETFSTCQSSDVESNGEFSDASLKSMRSNLNGFLYQVSADFIKTVAENSKNDSVERYLNKNSVNQVSEMADEQCLKQDDNESEIQDSGAGTKLAICDASKTETPACSPYPDSSTPLSNGDTEVIYKANPSGRNGCNFDSDSDTSEDSEEAMASLVKAYNRLAQENASNKERLKERIKIAGSYTSSSSGSGSSFSIDGEKADANLEKEFNKMIQGKRSSVSNEDTEVTKELIHAVKGNKKCFKGIKIADTKKPSESFSSISPIRSASDVTADSEKPMDDLCKDFDKMMQNETGTAKTGKFTKSRESSDSDTSTESEMAEDEPKKKFNITSHSKRVADKATRSVGSGHRSSDSETSTTKKFDKMKQRQRVVDNTTRHSKSSRQKHITINRPGRNKITYYYSGSSSESESDIDKYSKESHSSRQVGYRRKTDAHKKGKSKSEPSQFNHSNANDRSNSFSNPMPFFDPYYQPYPEQNQDYSNQMPFSGAYSNYPMQPTYASNPFTSHSYPQQQRQNYGEQGNMQSGYPMQPTYAYPQSYPYPNECPLKECCEMNKILPGSKTSSRERNARSTNAHGKGNSSGNHAQPNYNHTHQPYYASNQCSAPSEHRCHPPNEICQSPACATWYDMFYRQWQFCNQAHNF